MKRQRKVREGRKLRREFQRHQLDTRLDFIRFKKEVLRAVSHMLEIDAKRMTIEIDGPRGPQGQDA